MNNAENSVASSSSSNTRTSGSNPPPEHLSEFFSFMSNNGGGTSVNGSLSPIRRANKDKGQFISGERSLGFGSSSNSSVIGAGKGGIVRRPSLNTIDTFTSFSPSVLDLPNILTSKDYESAIQTYSNVLNKADALQRALDEVSRATSEFGLALEESINENPKVHNSKTVCDGINNAGGLQYMISSNQQILGRLLKQNFEVPLTKELEQLKQDYQTNHTFFQQEIRARSKELREKELTNIKLSKSKTRNLSHYKNNLVDLTRQVEEIDRLKYGYYHEINLMLEKFNQEQLLKRTGSLVRAQLEIYEGIAKKGWSGGGLDELLSVSPDLFAHQEEDEDTEEETQHRDGDNCRNDYADDAADDEDDTSVVRSSEFVNKINQLSPQGSSRHDAGNDTIETIRIKDNNTPVNGSDANSSTPIQDNRSSTPVHDISVDESFSLPIVSHSNSLLGSRSNESDSDRKASNAEDGEHDGHEENENAFMSNEDILSDIGK